MWKRWLLAPKRVSLLSCSSILLNSGSRPTFRPFSSKDENDLVQVITTKPRHVLKYVRQQVWKSRKRELQFRNSVTHIMIVLQEFLRKEVITPSVASNIMEGILEECVTYSQHDMAHLLFRAFMRFRKYGCQISVKAVRNLFESYKTSENKDLMLQLVDEMKEDSELRSLCIAGYLFAGKEAEAEELLGGTSYESLPKEDIVALVEGYAKLMKGDKVVTIVRELLSDESTASTVCDVALRALFHAKDSAAFSEVFGIVKERKIQLPQATFVAILRQKLRAVTKSESIQEVESELIDMGYEPSIAGASVIISAFVRLIQYGDHGSEELMLTKVDTLLSSIESRIKEGNPEDDISAAHVRAVIRGYGAAGKPDEMKAAWKSLQFDGIANDIRVYNELFKWYSLMGNVKEVLSLKEEANAASITLDANSYTWIFRSLGKFYPRHVEELYEELNAKHIRPDIHLFNSLLGVLGDLGQIDRVKSIQAEMQKRHEGGTLEYTSITFAVLLRIYQKDLDAAEKIYEQAKRMNLHDHPHVLTSMLHVLAFADPGGKKMEEFLGSIEHWSTDVYNVLLNKYSREKNVEKFNETIEKMKKEDVPMNDVTFGTLITAFARWGDSEKVNEVIQLLKEHEGQVSATFYSVLASSLSRMGKASGVDEAWEDLVSSKLFPDMEVYNQFLALYSRQHNVGKMQSVLNNMMKQVPPNPVTATTVLDMLGKTGHVTEMEDLFKDMKDTPDTLPTSVTFHQMMNTYAKNGDILKMEKIHEEFRKQGYTENAVTYNILMDGYGRSKRFEQLKELMEKRQKEGILVDDRAYCILITSFGRSRLLEEVQRLFDEVRSPTNCHLLSKRVLWSLIDAFCRCRDEQSIERCVELMKAATPTKELAIYEQLKLISYYCRMGNMEKVEDIVSFIQDKKEEVSYSAANALARGYSQIGRFEKCVEWLHYLRDRNWAPDPSTALHLSTAFLKAGLHDQAKQILEWRRQYVKHSTTEETEPTA